MTSLLTLEHLIGAALGTVFILAYYGLCSVVRR